MYVGSPERPIASNLILIVVWGRGLQVSEHNRKCCLLDKRPMGVAVKRRNQFCNDVTLLEKQNLQTKHLDCSLARTIAVGTDQLAQAG